MMKFKKFLAAAMTGAMMFGMVATAAPVASVIAADSVESKYDLTVDYRDFKAIITLKEDKEADPYVIFEVCKDENATKEGTKYTYEFEDEMKIDLSFLKASKVSYIRVYGSSETAKPKPTKVNAQPKKISVKYTSGKDLVKEPWTAFSVSKTALTEAAYNNAEYEYRTLYGSNFFELKKLDQKIAEVAGTTIVVRKAAVTSGSAIDKLAPASAEAKVKIPAAPKAPKVTIDYAKGNIKLPKNAEVQVIVSGAAIEVSKDGSNVTWVDATETPTTAEAILGLVGKKDTATSSEATNILKNGFTLVVRTKAGKKAASNPNIVPIKKVDSIQEEDNKLTVGEGTSAATLTWKVTKTGVEYTVTGAPFEYKDGTKWKTLKVGTTTVKGAITSNKEVEVRKAGAKATKSAEGSFPSEIAKITLVAYKAAIASVEITVPDTKVTPGASIVCTAKVKDEDGTDVTTGITWYIKYPGETEYVSNETAGTYTIPTDAAVGTEYTIKAECGGKDNTKTLKVVAAD